MQCACAILLSVACPAQQYFSTLSHKRRYYRQKAIEMCVLIFTTKFVCGPGGSVGIATDYGLDGPGLNPGGTRFSARPDRPWGPPSLLHNGYGVFSGGKVWPGRAADHSPPSSAADMEE